MGISGGGGGGSGGCLCFEGNQTSSGISESRLAGIKRVASLPAMVKPEDKGSPFPDLNHDGRGYRWTSETGDCADALFAGLHKVFDAYGGRSDGFARPLSQTATRVMCRLRTPRRTSFRQRV